MENHLHNTGNIIRFFLQAAELHPQHTAIRQGQKSVTYSQLKTEVEQRAAYMLQNGIKKGHRILVFIPPGIEMYAQVLAAFYIGASVVFMDEWVNRKRFLLCCRLAQCHALLAAPGVRRRAFFSSSLRKIPIWLRCEKKHNTSVTPAETSPSDTALITFTTGSTGIPKAADRTHGFLHAQLQVLLKEMNPSQNDVNLTLLPIVLLVNLVSGNTSVIPELKKGLNDEEMAQALSLCTMQNKVTTLTASPAILLQMKKACTMHSSVKNVFTGGAPVFPSDAAQLKKYFNQAVIHVFYGSTEAEPISRITADQLENMSLSRGLPVGHVSEAVHIKIIRFSLHPVNVTNSGWEPWELPVGEVGEIVVSGAHVLTRYFNNEIAQQQFKIKDKDTIWHRTGDSGKIDAEGKLYLWGPCRQLIQRNGKWISPFIAEGYLRKIPGIRTGTLLEENGIIILALETDRSREELTGLTGDITFDEIVIIQEIPRDLRHRSKIDYESLREKIRKSIR